MWNCVRLMGPIPCRSVYQNRKGYIIAVTFIRVVTHFRAETHIYQGRVDVSADVIKMNKQKIYKTMRPVTISRIGSCPRPDRDAKLHTFIFWVLFVRLPLAADLWASDGTKGEGRFRFRSGRATGCAAFVATAFDSGSAEEPIACSLPNFLIS